MDRNQQQQGQPGGYQGQQGARSQQNPQASQQGGRSYQQGGGQREQRSGQQSQQQAYGAQQFQNIAEVAVRSTALLWDLQMETARNLWRTQARTAAMLGVPDYSELFRIGDERARRIFSMSADQVLNSARQAREAVTEMQRQFERFAEQQTIGITEEVREQIEEIGRQTEQGLEEIKQMTLAQAEQTVDTAQQAMEWREEEQQRQADVERGGEAAPGAPREGGNGWQAQGEEGTRSPNAAAREAGEESQNASAEQNIAGEAGTPRETRRQEERSRARRNA